MTFDMLISLIDNKVYPYMAYAWHGICNNNFTKQMIVEFLIEKIPNGIVSYQEHGGDPRNYRVNFKKVKSALGFELKYTIKDGVEELTDLINNHVFDHVDENRNFYGNYEINYPIPS